MPRTATSPPTPPWCWPRPPRKKPRDIAEPLLPRLKANPDVVDGAVAGPGFINLKISDAFWRERLRECLKAGVAYGDSPMGQGAKVNVEYVSANPTGPLHCGACARRGGGRCARQPAGRRRAMPSPRSTTSTTPARRSTSSAQSTFLRYKEALGEQIGDDPRRPLSRRVPEGRRCGDRQARRRALDRQAAVRLAAGDARLRHRHPDGRDQDRPRDDGRPHRRLFVGARAGRCRRGRSRLPGAERARA